MEVAPEGDRIAIVFLSWEFPQEMVCWDLLLRFRAHPQWVCSTMTVPVVHTVTYSVWPPSMLYVLLSFLSITSKWLWSLPISKLSSSALSLYL